MLTPRRLVLALLGLVALSCTVWYVRDPRLHAATATAATSASQPGAGATQPASRLRHAANTHASHESAGAKSVALPEAPEPLAKVYDVLKSRADSGDVDAATRLFHEVHRCVALRQTRRLLAEFHAMFADNPAASSIGIVRGGQRLQFLQPHEMADYVQANAARCDGATDEQLDSFTPLLLQAAQRGDIQALDCYVGTDFDGMEGVLDHPEWIGQYRDAVPGLVESALQRGDWVIVDLLRRDPYSEVYDSSARAQVFGNDPVMDYRLLRLEQLGATDEFAEWLAAKVAGAAKALSPAQLAAAQEWATDYYSRYFNSASNEVAHGTDICQITDD